MPTPRLEHDRRQFLRSLGAGLTLPFFANRSFGASETGSPLFTSYGVNASFAQARQAKEAGANFLLAPTRKFLVPQLPESKFEEQLRLLEKSPLPVYTCNSFLTAGNLRSIGPDAKPKNVLAFADVAFQRARKAGVKRIVFGSSKSREIPPGWSKEQADEQMTDLLTKMGPLAEAQGVQLLLENLRINECNYLTTVAEVGAIVEQVNLPSVGVLADIYHSLHMDETPESFGRYAHLTGMVEIAEKEGRTAPGVSGEDFTPYFAALHKAGYSGPIEIEGKWKPQQLRKAFATIKEQADSVAVL